MSEAEGQARSANGVTVAVADLEIVNMRHNLQLMRAQAQAGRVDPAFLTRQLDKMGDLLVRLEAEHRQLNRQGRGAALYNVSKMLGASLDLQAVLDQVMDAIIQLTAAERGFLMLRDDDGSVAVKTARNFDQQTLTSDQFKFSRSVVFDVLDKGEAVVTTNAAEDPRFATQASILSQSLRSIAAVPLRVRGRVIGVIYVDARTLTGFLEDDDFATLEAFAGQAAVAIDNAQLFSEAEGKLAERVGELQQLRRFDLLLNETLDLERTMDLTLEWACRMTDAAAGFLGFIDGDLISLAYDYGIPPDEELPALLDVAFPQTRAVIAANAITTVEQDGLNLLLAPIGRKHTAIGVLVLRRAAPFSADAPDRVAQLVARAVVTIENARLYAAVQAADRAKSEFVGVVAHDLKVPMSSILGYSDLTAMDDNLLDHQKTYLQRIRATVRRMELLVSDLADISRIESGLFYMDASRVNVGDVVQGVHDAILTQMEARRHHWTEQIEADLPPVRADYYRLLQVLTNLTSNAYKYTPDGGTITLAVRRLAGTDGERIAFSVQDTGIGLPPEAIAKLGTKFWRAEDNFTRAQPGTGLGFAITRALVEQMGSHIQIESEVGRGSRFTFSIPVWDDAASA